MRKSTLNLVRRSVGRVRVGSLNGLKDPRAVGSDGGFDRRYMALERLVRLGIGRFPCTVQQTEQRFCNP
jgi:hypothetical protein